MKRKTRWTIIADGKYAGSNGKVSWTYSRREANEWAKAIGGKVVDAEKLIRSFKRKAKAP